MDAERGHTARGGDQSAVGEHLPSCPGLVRCEQKGYRMVRYADDFVVLCRSAEEAQAALAEVKAWVEANGLSLNAEKTHVGDCRQRGQGFDFLGYRFEAGRRWVRRKSLKAHARSHPDEDQAHARGQSWRNHRRI